MALFSEKLKSAIDQTSGCLCVGLDLDLTKWPEGLSKDSKGALAFLKSIIEVTADLAVAYKPNMAFFESMGKEGIEILENLRSSIPDRALLVMDAKRGDIGNTSQAYAKAFYENMRADGVTLSPYMGRDSIDPFLNYSGTCSFVLCLTSNPSAADFQLQTLERGQKLYEWVAQTATGWSAGKKGEIGLVVGATQTPFLQGLRHLVPDTVFLVPGVGAQGGDLQAVLQEGRSSNGYGILVNVSRQILYASHGRDFAKAARAEAQKLVDQMKQYFSKDSRGKY